MGDTVAQLKGLKELLDGGVLTQGEFDAQKSVILAGQAQSTMSGKPTGPRFDSSTGQPIPKFDTQTGKQNWWDEEGGQQLGLPPPPAIMMQPGMVDEKTYNVAVPPGPLGLQFHKGTCTVHAVTLRSPLRGVTKEGETLLAVNGKLVTPTTMLDEIEAADDGTSERKLVFRTTAPAMKAEGTPAGMTAGGTWVEQTYVGPQTSQCACLACLCFGLPGLCVLCFPTDKRMVYVNLGANAKPGPGKAALPDGSIVNYSKGGGSGPMIQRGPTAPIITEPGREVS